MNMTDRPSGMKREPTFSDITSVSLPEIDADATPEAAKQEEAQQILYEWAKHGRPNGLAREAVKRIEALEAENARLKTAIATHGAEACGILRSYHQEDGNRLWLALRAALAQDNPTRDQGAGDQAADA